MTAFHELPRHTISQLIPQEVVDQRVGEIAAQIKETHDGVSVVLLGVLTGATRFTMDLGESLWALGAYDVMVDFVGIESYGAGMESNHQPKVTKFPKNPVKGSDLFLVEDIADTGYSLSAALRLLYSMGANSVRTVALLSKESRREIEVPLNYVGFEIPDKFVVGYGIDWKEQYRFFPGIGVVELEG